MASWGASGNLGDRLTDNPFSKNNDYGISPLGLGGDLRGLFGGSKGGGGTTANDILAAVTKDQWYSYLNQIGAPQERQLMQFATDPNVVNNAVAEAGADSTAAFDRASLNNDQMLRSLGLTLNADEKKASDRSFELARSLGDVQSREMARRGTVSLQQSVLGSPAPRIGG